MGMRWPPHSTHIIVVILWSSVQVAIAEAGGIRALVTLARDGTKMQKDHAVGALANLACNDANKV